VTAFAFDHVLKQTYLYKKTKKKHSGPPALSSATDAAKKSAGTPSNLDIEESHLMTSDCGTSTIDESRSMISDYATSTPDEIGSIINEYATLARDEGHSMTGDYATSTIDESHAMTCDYATSTIDQEGDAPVQRAYTLVPTLADKDSPLNWRPLLLRPQLLWTNVIVCLMLAGSIIGVLSGIGSDRVFLLTSANADVFSTYAPTTIAAINVAVFQSTITEMSRMLPFMRMADQNGKITSGDTAARSVGGAYFPFPFAHTSDNFTMKIPIRILLVMLGWLASAKSVLLKSQQTPTGFSLTVQNKPAFFLITAYACMAMFYFTLYCVFQEQGHRPTVGSCKLP